MDPVGEHVDVVDVLERPVGELVPFLLPLGGEPGDHRCRQPGRRAEELLQGGDEVPRAHPVQVHQRQHLGHLGRPPGPRRQDQGPEAHPFARHLVDPTVVDPWSQDLDGSRPGDQRPGHRVAVAHHQPVALVIALGGQGGHVGVDLGLEGGSQHAPRTFSDQFVQRGRQLRVRGLINMYSQHWRSFLAGVPPPAFL